MKCSMSIQTRVSVVVVALSAVLSLTCDESLPVYVFPKNVLSFKVSLIEQVSNRLAPPWHQAVHMVLIGQNIHDEVFQDSVDIKGSVRIWWKRKPVRYRTMYLSQRTLTDPSLINNGRMTLLPGQQFAMDLVWNLKSDDSLYLPSEMTFDYARRRMCDFNVICSDPETFVAEASLQVFDRLGYIAAPAVEFIFIGTVCSDCRTGGPYCPIPPNGCGN